MARRGYERKTEALEIVVRTREPANLELAAVAGARIDLPDVQRTPEPRPDITREGGAEPRWHLSVKGQAGKEALDKWISWARRCRIPVFVELASRIVTHRDPIDAALDHGLSQGLIESTNTKIRVLTRIAFGFHNAEALIALAMLALGGHRPALPGRA